MDALWLRVRKQALRGAHTAPIARYQHHTLYDQTALSGTSQDLTGPALAVTRSAHLRNQVVSGWADKPIAPSHVTHAI